MQLFRLHAYAVEPQRTRTHGVEPIGGAVGITSQLRQVIDQNVSAAHFDTRTQVALRFDTHTRTSDIRDLILRYAFKGSRNAEAAAAELANRLSDAMDLRSTPCLFVLAAMREAQRRCVTLWTFPRDQAFQFRSGRGGPSIRVLTDVFSQTSKLRKAAYFEGRQLRTHFLNGKVLDFQASHASQDIANFWIMRFLQCELSMADDTGTRLLARTVKKATQRRRGDCLTAITAARSCSWSAISGQLSVRDP